MTTAPTILLFCLFAFLLPRAKSKKSKYKLTMKPKNMLFCLFAFLAPMARAKRKSRFCFFWEYQKRTLGGVQISPLGICFENQVKAKNKENLLFCSYGESNFALKSAFGGNKSKKQKRQMVLGK